MGSAGGYIVNFASIILGLALADMLIDFDRLLRFRKQVRWYPLPFIASAFVLMVLIAAWWELYFLASVRTITVAYFLPYFGKLVLIFLLAAAVLPSEWQDRIDLKAYYFDNRVRMFGTWWLLALLILTMPILQGEPFQWPSLFSARGLVAMPVLAFTRRPLIHWILLPTLFVLFTWQWLDIAIGTGSS